MEKIELKTSNAPAAIGPYSQGIRANGFVFVSGQIPIDPATGAFAGDDIVSQTHQCLKNVREILRQAGADMESVVRADVYLKHISDFAAMNEVYAQYFDGVCPARAAVQVAAIPRDALVEIGVIAAL
ncbi:MAG: RidA family protein [Oscillospiraceae bacterium]|nr:RidA family protein [Oscillospiraceae bacterium]